MGFRVSVSLHPAIQATGRLTFAPAGSIPAEHTSLRWTHKRIRLLSDEERARRATRGRPFANGNPGRKPGSKNRSTLVAEALLSDEKDELLRKAIELAKAGDVQMLKFLLERTLPKERSVRVELPLTDGDFDAVATMEAILVAATTGQILPSEASELASIVAAYARTLDITELRLRLENVEKDLGGLKQ